MGERLIVRQTRASPIERVLAFMDDFRDAPEDTNIKFRVGATAAGVPAVMVSFAGREHFLLASEARKVADIMAETLVKFPAEPESKSLPNIILGLRYAASKATSDD